MEKVMNNLTAVKKSDLMRGGSVKIKLTVNATPMSHKIHNREGGGNCQAPCNVDLSLPVQPPGGALWNSPIGRRTFLKRTGGATLATALALHGTRVQVQAAVTAQKQVKLSRTIVFTTLSSNQASGVSPLQEDYDVALAKAYTELVKNLGQAGAISISSDVWQTGDVPTNWVLKSFDKYGSGTVKPGPLVEDDRYVQFFDDVPPPQPETGYIIEVIGHLAESSGTITFKWTWGAP